MSAHELAVYTMKRTYHQIVEPLLRVGALTPSKLNKIISHIEEKSVDIIDIAWSQYEHATVIWIGLIGAAFVILVAGIIYFNATAQLKPKEMRCKVRTY